MSRYTLVYSQSDQTTFLALNLVSMQKSVRCALMCHRENRLRHADDDCKNSFIIQVMPQVKGLLLFKAAAGSTDNQEQLLL